MKPRLVAPHPGVTVLILVGARGPRPRRMARLPDPGSRRAGETTSDHRAGVEAASTAPGRARRRTADELARLIREMAEVAERRYVEVTFPRELAEIERGIRIAVLDLAWTKDALEKTRKRQQFRPFLEPSVSMDLTFKKAEFTLEQALSKRKVLVDYTDRKTRREFKDVIEKLRANEIARERVWEREEAREVELLRRLDPI